MKKVSLILLVIAFISCQETKVNYTLLSGNIENSKDSILKISTNFGKKIKEIKIKDNGFFSDTIYNSNGYFKLSTAGEYLTLYLNNGFNLELVLDTKQFDETVLFNGIGSEVNNYLAKKILILEKYGFVPTTDKEMKAIYTLDEKEYLSRVNLLKTEIIKELTSLSNSKFKEMEEEFVNYEYIQNLAKYQPLFRFVTGESNFKASESYMSFIEDLKDEIAYDNLEHFLNSQIYRSYFNKNFKISVYKKSQRENITIEKAILDTLSHASFNQLMIEELLKDNEFRVTNITSESEEFYQGILNLSSDEAYKQYLTKLYEKLKKVAKLSKGAISPLFKDYESVAGGKISLSDLKGKYIYIDVWATWCLPCIREFPSLKKIESKYSGKNIEFVSISVDQIKDKGKWQKMIKNRKLGGIQLLADKGLESEFISEYGILSIPRFILIDPFGKIVSADAPRPSDAQLLKMFNELGI